MRTIDSYDYQRIQTAIEYLAQNFQSQPNLEEVAEKVHLSPYHFQRLFTEWAGVSPKKFLQHLTVDYMKQKIKDSANLLALADEAGLSSQSRVYDLFVNIEALTPAEYKTDGKGLRICYGYHLSPFGMCFIAVSERGVCALEFIEEDTKRKEYEEFAAKWAFADLIHEPQSTQPVVEQIFFPNPKNRKKLTILAKGTNFRLKVWRALLNIPTGSVTTYQQIAETIGQPKAVRAVGSAVGENPIAYLIPCHRVIRKEGKLGEYHWGSARKKAMLGVEMAQVSA